MTKEDSIKAAKQILITENSPAFLANLAADFLVDQEELIDLKKKTEILVKALEQITKHVYVNEFNADGELSKTLYQDDMAEMALAKYRGEK